MSSRQILGRVLSGTWHILTTAAIRPLIFDQKRPGRTTSAGRDLALLPSLAGLLSLVIHSPPPGPIPRPGDNRAGPVSAAAVAAKHPGPCDDPGARRRRPGRGRASRSWAPAATRSTTWSRRDRAGVRPERRR